MTAEARRESAVEWDLDTDAGSGVDTGGATRWRGRATGPRPAAVGVAVLALLIGVLGGGSLRAAIAPVGPAPGSRPAALLSLLDVRLDDGPVVTLRLVVSNPGREPIQLDGLTIAGVSGSAAVAANGPVYLTRSSADADGVPRITLALSREVPPGGSRVTDVELHPECARVGGPRASAELLLDRARAVHVPLAGGLDEGGTLCRQVGAALPLGWQAPIAVPAGGVRQVGNDLRITLPGLGDGAQVAGLWAGEEILGIRNPSDQPGPDTQVVQVIRPEGCLGVGSTGSADRVPTGVRVMVIRPRGGGLLNRYAAIGPAFADWLLRGC